MRDSEVDRLARFPRTSLVPAVTPLHELDGLSRRFQFPLYAKRDDLTGFGIGGNKARKLEYLIGDALDKRASCLVTGGGIQSNFAAMTAIAARRADLECHLALVEAVPVRSLFYDEGGNIAIDRLAGAEIRRFPAGSSIDECVSGLAAEILETTGHAPYEIPIGGSNGVGALGFVRGALEYAEQATRCASPIDTIVVASGSAGTQAGLIVGLALAGCDQAVIGFSVLHTGPELRARVLALCETLAEMLDLAGFDWSERIHVDDGFIGKGYGLPMNQTWESIETLIASDGVICDPVYSGKALHGLLSYLEERRPELGRGVVFWHTGGGVGLLAYADQIKSRVDSRQ